MTLAKGKPSVNSIVPPVDRDLSADLAYQTYVRNTDHDEKTAWLSQHFPPVNPYDYYTEIFHGQIPEQMPVQFLDDAKPTTAKAAGFFELAKYGKARSAATPLATFYNAWRSRATLENVHALVIDVEDVLPASLPILVKQLDGSYNKGRSLMPTYINLSGGGVHLVYLFKALVEGYNWRKPYLDGLLKALKAEIAHGWNVDMKCSTVQAVRIVGGVTKYGDECLSFRVGNTWEPATLAQQFGLMFPENNPHQMMLFPKEAGEVEEAKPKKATVAILPKYRPSFWYYCYIRLVNRADPGNRHMQLFALAVVGYKCRIKRQEVEEHLQTIIDIYNQRNRHDPLPGGELEKAMTGYSQKFLRVKADTLAEWTGLEFKKNKRNGRTQKQHLTIARASRNARQAVDKKAAIETYISKHPGASQVEIARALKMSRDTVRKYQGGAFIAG